MGIAALVLGIVSIILGFVPFCNIFMIIPAIIGLILGIIDLVRKKKASEKFGMPLAGLICSSIAIVVIFVYYVAIGALVTAGVRDGVIRSEYNEVSSSWNWNIDINE